MRKILLVAFLALAALGVSAKTLRTLVVTTTPQMHCANCENKIKGNLRFEKGVKRIETSIPDQTVTIIYDAEKTTEAELIKSFAKFNYQARALEAGEKVEKNTGEACGNM